MQSWESRGGGVRSLLSCFANNVILVLSLFIVLSCRKEHIESNRPLLELSSAFVVFEYEGGTKSITIFSQTDWNVGDIPDWLKIEISENSILNISVDVNNTSQIRNGKIHIETQGEEQFVSIRQNAKPRLNVLNKSEIVLPSSECSISVDIDANVPYEVEIKQDEEWLDISRKINNITQKSSWEQNISQDKLTIYAAENANQSERTAIVIIRNTRYSLSDTIHICQRAYIDDSDDQGTPSNVFNDGEVIVLQKATKGNVNLVIMGDGFTSKHLDRNGFYESSAKLAVEHFFSLEPYTTYRDYFNVYMVIAESQTEEIGTSSFYGQHGKETVFKTRFGSGTSISCDDDTVFKYIEKISTLDEESPVLCILMLNIDRYAGTCYMYQDGNAIALCPMSTVGEQYDFEALIHHEAGGHGFGFFADEYVYYNKQMPYSTITNIQDWQELGYQLNIDFTDNPDEVHWHSLIGLSGYEGVGMYEGGQEYRYGVWRSEENSCMNDNIPYYSTHCRWLIYKRIMKLSGQPYSLETFLETDIHSTSRQLNAIYRTEKFIPSGPPVLIEKSPRH